MVVPTKLDLANDLPRDDKSDILKKDVEGQDEWETIAAKQSPKPTGCCTIS